jgi:hypothetical protein
MASATAILGSKQGTLGSAAGETRFARFHPAMLPCFTCFEDIGVRTKT